MPPVWKREPSILLCPQVPRPMHGLAPRTILGAQWWDATRKAAYASTGYRCLACAVHKHEAKFHYWLEGHELYDVDYLLGRLYYVRTVPLCHACHSFIHFGRLDALLRRRQITQGRYASIVQHGERVLHEAGLVKHPPYCGPCASWEDWRLVLFGKEYPPLYGSYEEWERFHSA